MVNYLNSTFWTKFDTVLIFYHYMGLASMTSFRILYLYSVLKIHVSEAFALFAVAKPTINGVLSKLF